MSTHKVKHLHAILATVHIAIEYDPQDLGALTTLNAQIRDAARQMTGYRDIEVRLGKVPAPAEKPAAIVVHPETDLTPPAFLRGSAQK